MSAGARSFALLAVLVLSACDGSDGTPPRTAASASASASAPAAADATRFVSADGDDDAAGTAQAPWRTLGHALEELRPGDVLDVDTGTYDADLEPRLTPGTAKQRITVRGRPGAVVKGLVRLNQPDYWTFEGLEFTWGGGSFDEHMVKVAGGTGWVLDGLRIHDSRSRAGLLIAKSVRGGAPHDYVLRNSAVYDSKRGANVYLNPGLDATGGLIERNLLFGSPTENIKIGFGGSCKDQEDPLFGAAGVIVRNNTLYDAEQPLTIAEPARGIDVYGNLIVRSRGVAVVRLDGECGNLSQRIRVHDNLGADAERFCEDGHSPLTCKDADGGGNVFHRSADFDGTGPDAFRPRDRTAQQYGRYAGR